MVLHDHWPSSAGIVVAAVVVRWTQRRGRDAFHIGEEIAVRWLDIGGLNEKLVGVRRRRVRWGGIEEGIGRFEMMVLVMMEWMNVMMGVNMVMMKSVGCGGSDG